MNDEPRDPSSESIFSKLPDSRPGRRSPRRRTTRSGAGEAAAAGNPANAGGGEGAAARATGAKRPVARATSRKGPAAKTEPPHEGEPRPRPEPPHQAPAAADVPRGTDGEPVPEPPPHEAPGLEDLAWAGVAAAAEAATIGVRLASRMLEALRGPSERH